MDMRLVDPALYRRPEPFDPVRASPLKADIFVGAVVDRHVAVAALVQPEIVAHLVGLDPAAEDHVGVDDRGKCRLALVRNDMRHNVAAAFGHAHDDRLGRAKSADKRLVDLDMLAGSADWTVAVQRAHIFPDLMAHAPCRLVGHAKLALDFLGSDTVPRRAEHEHDEKPVAQRGPRAIKRRARGRKHLKATPFASVGPTRFDAIELSFAYARSAFVNHTETSPHQMVETDFLGRKLVKKGAVRGGIRFHTPLYNASSYLAQGYNTRHRRLPLATQPKSRPAAASG